MNEVPLEKIVSLVVQEVVKELQKNGIKVVSVGGGTSGSGNILTGNTLSGFKAKVEHIDMSKYKTPLLTENHIDRLHELTGEIVIPKGTIMTPKAREAVKRKNISIQYN